MIVQIFKALDLTENRQVIAYENSFPLAFLVYVSDYLSYRVWGQPSIVPLLKIKGDSPYRRR